MKCIACNLDGYKAQTDAIDARGCTGCNLEGYKSEVDAGWAQRSPPGWKTISQVISRATLCIAPGVRFWCGLCIMYREQALAGSWDRVEICQCRQCRRQCKIFASGVNFSIFTHFFVFLSLKLLKLGEIDGVKFLAWKSGGVKFLTNFMSELKWKMTQFFKYLDVWIVCKRLMRRRWKSVCNCVKKWFHSLIVEWG